eukprot:1159601-Pelagomonas_calceolata.AAC.1
MTSDLEKVRGWLTPLNFDPFLSKSRLSQSRAIVGRTSTAGHHLKMVAWAALFHEFTLHHLHISPLWPTINKIGTCAHSRQPDLSHSHGQMAVHGQMKWNGGVPSRQCEMK